MWEHGHREPLPPDVSGVWRAAVPAIERRRERPDVSAADRGLRLRRDGDRVRLEDPSRPDAWLAIDDEQVFDAAAVNDLP